MIANLTIGRRRLLTLTASGISAVALGGLARPRQAYAAEAIRWVSPRGTIEVLDDYPYWVGKKYGYFGDIETSLEPGPSDATATVKLVDQNRPTSVIRPRAFSPWVCRRACRWFRYSKWAVRMCSISPSGKARHRLISSGH